MYEIINTYKVVLDIQIGYHLETQFKKKNLHIV